MKYMTAVIAVCFTLLGCGSGDRSRPATASERGAAPADHVDRDASERDVLPVSTDSLRLQNVAVDLASARQAARLGNGFTVWSFRGEQTGPAVLSEGSAVVCLAIIDRSIAIAAKCAAETVLDDPSRSMITLSGGAAGAPGLRPREVIVVGALADPATRVSLVSHRSQPIGRSGVVGGVYWLRTRAAIAGARFWVREGDEHDVRFDACQSC